MFRDRDEELARLQAQLLEETEQENQILPEEDEFLQEEVFDEILADTDRVEDCGVYQNFSNDYGKGLRNYASGYKAYNADKADVDLDDLSEELLNHREKSGSWAWVVLALLLISVVGVIVWIFLVLGGLL